MKKATTEDFNNVLENFKSKNNIEDKSFDYYATFKFYKATCMGEFYDIRLMKTNSSHYPLLINHSSNNLLAKSSISGIFEDFEEKDNIKTVPIIKDKDVIHLQQLFNNLNESHSFKDLVNSLYLLDADLDIDVTGISKGTSVLKIIQAFQYLKEEVSKEDVQEGQLRYHIESIVDKITEDLFTSTELSTYKLLHLFRIRSDENPDNLMNTYYEKFDECFDLFKLQQSLMIGRMLNAETENQVLNKPLLNHFIEEVKTAYPEWFKSFDESLTHGMTDDNAIRASGIPLQTATADFDLLNPRLFMATAYPSYTDGYSHTSNRFMSSEDNFVHLYGDNPFVKLYYHNLQIETDKDSGITFCKGIDSDTAYCIKPEKRKDFIYPVLDYLEKNKIVLELTKHSTLLHIIKREELMKVIKDKYPNLVALDFENNYKKSITMLHAKSFDEAFAIHMKKDDVVEPVKAIKNKPTF